MVIKKLSLLILLIVMVSCGARDRSRSDVFLVGQVSLGMPAEYKDKDGVITGLERQKLFLDTDKDGIRDRDDFDIDNDGVPNDCDMAPFSAALGTEDSDKDGIPDFCDTDEDFQTEIFTKFGLMLNLNESLDFDRDELKKQLSHVSSKTLMPGKDLLTLAVTESLPMGEYGNYDNKWKNIRFRYDAETHEEFPELLQANWVLMHELFHFVAQANGETYKEVVGHPTEYSKVSVEEQYAEVETFKYFFPWISR